MAHLFDHFFSLGRAAGIDAEPAGLRIDPDEGRAATGEGTRHKFLGHPFAQFIQLLAADRIALLFLDRIGPFPDFLVDDGRRQTSRVQCEV